MSPLAFISKLERRFVKSRETLKLEPDFFYRFKWFFWSGFLKDCS